MASKKKIMFTVARYLGTTILVIVMPGGLCLVAYLLYVKLTKGDKDVQTQEST